ncbi:Alpha/Beta hydrolase protein [Chlamydoabsidia padenii]|nr:Alpha/Beta hydrolase protein [Chlamydoabsidia padenii]
MSYSKACCSIPPVESNYTPTGTMEQVGDLTCYVAGPADAKKAIVVIYDIFALHNNTKQFADILAKHCNYKVVMPDFFRGEVFDHTKLGDREVLLAWIGKYGSLNTVAPDLDRVIEWLKSNGAIAGGVVGFCWGAKIAAQYSAMDSTHFFAGMSMIHPSFVDVKDAEVACAPVLALPSKDEPDMTEYMEVLAKKPFGKLCKHHRFDDMPHGFAATRGDYTDELNVKRTTEAIQLTVNFFNECISEQHPGL